MDHLHKELRKSIRATYEKKKLEVVFFSIMYFEKKNEMKCLNVKNEGELLFLE